MGCIRRIVLDAFWSRSSSTVTTNAAMMRATMLTTTSMLGHSEGPYGDPGPLPAYDHCGYLVAMQMVASSRGKGRYSPTHKQWDTIRKIKTLFSSHYRATAKANTGAVTMMSTKGVGPQVLTQDPCCSLWFQRFSEECRKRMGQEWRPDKAISVRLVGELLAMVEQRVMDATETKDKVKWLLAGGYFCICYVVSLRSTEGLLCDVEGLLDHYNERSDHVVMRPGKGRTPFSSAFDAVSACDRLWDQSQGVDKSNLGGTCDGWSNDRTGIHKRRWDPIIDRGNERRLPRIDGGTVPLQTRAVRH